MHRLLQKGAVAPNLDLRLTGEPPQGRGLGAFATTDLPASSTVFSIPVGARLSAVPAEQPRAVQAVLPQLLACTSSLDARSSDSTSDADALGTASARAVLILRVLYEAFVREYVLCLGGASVLRAGQLSPHPCRHTSHAHAHGHVAGCWMMVATLQTTCP